MPHLVVKALPDNWTIPGKWNFQEVPFTELRTDLDTLFVRSARRNAIRKMMQLSKWCVTVETVQSTTSMGIFRRQPGRGGLRLTGHASLRDPHQFENLRTDVVIRVHKDLQETQRGVTRLRIDVNTKNHHEIG